MLSGDGALPLYNFGNRASSIAPRILDHDMSDRSDIDVNIPIACMAETCYGNVIFLLKLFSKLKQCHYSSGNHDVFIEFGEPRIP